jgi:glycosyltransferase involved in cell wall biosynthesis
MRILLLSQWYTPEPDIRIHLLGRELVARGHQVTVITGFPNYPSGRVYPGYRIRWRQWEEHDGLRILRLPLYPDHSRSHIKRVLNFISFAASASTIGLMLCGSADVMWVYHPPLTTAIPAWLISKVRGVPFIYEVQDMWPETLAATGMLPSPRIARWVGSMARFIYRHASAVTVISQGFKRNLIAKGVPGAKIHVVPNWADEQLFRPLPRDEQLARRHGLTGHFNIVYGGNMGAAQALDNVLRAATLLHDLPNVRFVLIGDGVDEARLRQAVEEQGLTNVAFIGRQPMTEMPRFFALADVLLIHLNRDPLFEITVPGKMTAYLACGKPILCAVAGEAAEVIANAAAGLVCPPENAEALAQSVRRLYFMSSGQRDELGQAGRRAFLTSFTREALMKQYVDVFAAVTQPEEPRQDADTVSRVA